MSNKPTRTHAVAFNTGAFYTSKGQRIAAWVKPIDNDHCDVACLVDFDRQICCYFPFTWSGQFSSAVDFARHVMHMYEWGQYPLRFVEGLGAEMSDVMHNGWEAFCSCPDVHVIADVRRPY